jgi:diguanylate cyclase (GGDEF)-like protein
VQNLVPVTYVLQTTSASIIASIIYFYFKSYQRPYLKHWALSFFALSVFLLCSAALTWLARNGFKHTDLLLFAFSFVKINAGFFQIVWLFFGIYVLYFTKVNPLSNARPIYILTFFIASTLVCLYAFDSEGGLQRNTLRSGSRYLLGGIAFFICSVLLILAPTRHSLGRILVGGAFLIYGIELAVLGVLNVRMLLGYDWQLLSVLVKFHGLFELLVYPLIGLGLIIWLLEHERYKSQAISAKLAGIDFSDPLTGLANRKGFEKIVGKWQLAHHDSSDSLLIILMGIDQFKRFNISGGIKQGDDILIAIGNRINLELTGLADKARIEGDIFAFVIENRQQSIKEIEILRRRISRKIQVNNQNFHIDTSIGVSIHSPQDSIDQSIAEARRALSQAKRNGGKQVIFFDEKMPEEINLVSHETELRKALDENEFEAYLQPIHCARTEKINGFELLVRWNHPQRGVLSPASFLPFLSQLNLMPKLDIWTLGQAVDLLNAWKSRVDVLPFIAVNLSPEGLQNDEYLDQLPSIVNRLGRDIGKLCIEITENSAMKSISSGRQSLAKIRDLGVKFAIDDFGTGYSSLNYLRSFPANKIKFDRSFINAMIEDETSLTILRSLVPLCQGLKREVVAEGVESEVQVQMAKAIGFDQLQGYFFAKPMTIEKALQLVERSVTKPFNFRDIKKSDEN